MHTAGEGCRLTYELLPMVVWLHTPMNLLLLPLLSAGVWLIGLDRDNDDVIMTMSEVLRQIESLDQILDDATVPGPTTMSAVSLARHDYEDKLEAAINEQIK
jgi:hypothetical protein